MSTKSNLPTKLAEKISRLLSEGKDPTDIIKTNSGVSLTQVRNLQKKLKLKEPEKVFTIGKTEVKITGDPKSIEIGPSAVKITY